MSAGAAEIQAVTRLIEQVIDSFEKLEIVVFVSRSGFAVKPQAADIAKSLSLPTDEVDKCMKTLERDGVLQPAGPWRTAVDALVKMYDDDRIEVLNLMTRTALARVRKQAARAFADAFVLRPKKKGDPDA
ncbi:MAG TPA: hypothetical protein VIV11_26300 [Kofleriaceae bacterium]